MATKVAVAAGTVAVTIGAYRAFSTPATMTSAAAAARTKTFGYGPSFTSLKLHSVETISPDTKRFRFELPDKEAVSGLSLTSTLLTFSKPEGHWLPVIRPYTPVSDLDEPGFVELVIKKYPKGKASSHIHALAPGQSLSILGAMRGYVWKPNEFSQITLIAGGAGITPMYQLIRGILKNPSDQTKITLLFGINTDADALFRKEFAEYEKSFPDRFKVIYTVSSPAKDSQYRKGRISRELLEEVLPEKKETEKDTKIFLCGPPAMEKALLDGAGGGILEQLGYTKKQVHKF